ncbi:glycogen/starch synthase [bacterium]|nr:glycogen/starch synthase [bacterium]
MNDRLNILFVAPEVAPFARAGDMGYVTGGLPKALKEMGHDVRIITPQYRVTNERRYVLREVIRLHDIQVELAGEPVKFHVKSAFLPHTKVQVYFLNYRPFYFRQGLYTDIETDEFYSDNEQRYELLALGALETLKRLRWQPDIVHCHGWASSWVPYHLKTHLCEDDFFKSVSTLYTLYDGLHTGPLSAPVTEKNIDNMLQLGLNFCDGANIAVSPARPSLVESLPSSIFDDEERYSQIINGFDGCRWNPESDPYLKSRYSEENFDGKSDSKRRLLTSFKLDISDVDAQTILVIWANTVNELKAKSDEILSIAKQGWIVLLFVPECGDPEVLKEFEKHSDVVIRFPDEPDEAAFHRLLAGSDVLWLISSSAVEQHLHQVGPRYGTVTLLDDDVENMIIKPQVDDFKAPACTVVNVNKIVNHLDTLKTLYADRQAWNAVAQESMNLKYSWVDVAVNYVELYKKCISTRKE